MSTYSDYQILKDKAIANAREYLSYLQDGDYPLHRAVMDGENGLMYDLLQAGADVNAHAHDEGGATPLHVAVGVGNMHACIAIIGAGADVNLRDDYGETPLHEACYSGHTSVPLIHLLMDAGANPKLKDISGKTPKDVAREMGHVKAWQAIGEYHELYWLRDIRRYEMEHQRVL